MTGVIWRKDRT